MENEPRSKSQHRKRRERAHQVPLDNSETDGEAERNSQSQGPAGRGRSKPRKKRGGAGKYEEDIIDGFAIISFTSVDDLEKFSAGKLSVKNNVSANKLKNNNSLPLGQHKSQRNLKKKERNKEKKPPGVISNHKHKRDHSAGDGETSGETTDQFDTGDLLNGSFRRNSRRLSEVSTISSSGAGYMCSDSESIDDQVSDGSDIFTTKPLNHTIKRDPVLPVYPPSLPCSTTVTTACTVTSTTSDVTVSTSTTTTSCVSLVTTPKTTPSTVTTASPTVNGPHRHNNHQPQISQYQPPVSHEPVVSHQPSLSQPPIQTSNSRTYQQNSHHIPASHQQSPQSQQPTPQHHHQQQQNQQHSQQQQRHQHSQQSHHQSQSHQSQHHQSQQHPSQQQQQQNLNQHPHPSATQQSNQHPNQQTGQHPNQHLQQLPNQPANQANKANQHPNQHPNHHPKQQTNQQTNQHLNQHSNQHPNPHSNPLSNQHSTQHSNQHSSQHSNRHSNQQSSQHSSQHTSQYPHQTQLPNPQPNHNNQHQSPHHQSHHQQQQQHSHHHNQQRPKHDRPTSNSPTVGIKRRPTTPQLTKSRSPPPQPKPHIAVPPVPHQLPSTVPPASTLSLSNTVISKEARRSTPPSRPRSPRRDNSRDRERETHQVLPASVAVTKSFFPAYPAGHGSTTPTVYSPLRQSPLPLHSTPSHTPTFPGAPVSSHHAHRPPTPQGHNMFAPPMPLAPPPQAVRLTPPVTAASAHLAAETALSLSGPDVLRDELNRRFLASQDRSALLQSVPPYMKADVQQHMHQHQHQHQHQHTHQHTYNGLTGSAPPGPLVSTPTPPHLYDKLPPGSPFYRQPGVGLPHRPSGSLAEPNPRHQIPNGKDKPITPQHPRSAIPAMPGYPSLLLNPSVPGGAGALNSGIPGAFQPKNVSSLNPASVLLPGMREREKTPTLSSTPLSSLPGVKKSGKWCAVHVRVAWEIYHHQQKPSDKGPDIKPVDPLRPFIHMLPGGSVPRPQDLAISATSPLLGSNPVFDSSGHMLLNSVNPIPASPFPRPSPYAVGGIVGIGAGGALPSTSRESPVAIPSGSQHDLARLHRTPPNFPPPPGWPRPEDRDPRERDMERELERRREEDRERERRMREEQDRHRFASLDERGRERDHYRNAEMLAKSRSRSRSRSPMTNGRIETIKLERSFDERRRMEENNFLKIKEERREREDELLSERERLLKNDYLTSSALRAADPYLQANLLDRTRMLVPGAVFAGERVPPPHVAWNPFDRGQMELHNHRLLQREMEHTRDQLLNRFPTPQVAMGMAVLEQERLKEDLLLREERARREYLERLPLFERERLYYENSKLPMLRPPDPLSVLNHPFSRTMSPHINKSSPAMLPGAPPPLIHSVSAAQSRIHPGSSSAVHKTKGVSPTDSVGESKRDSNSTSTDPDAHSR